MRKLVLLLLLTTSTSHANNWNLNDCINYALNKQVDIKRQELKVGYAEDAHKQSKMERLPSLNGEYYHQYSSGRSLNKTTYNWDNTQIQQGNLDLATSIPIYQGGYINNLINKNKFVELQSKSKLESYKNQTILKVMRAYSEALFYKENLALAQKQLELIREQNVHTKLLVEKGQKSDIDLLEIDARVVQEEAKVLDAENNHKNAIFNLQRQMGYPKSYHMDVQGLQTSKLLAFPIPDADSLYNYALTFLPQVKSYDYELKSLSHQLASINAYQYPSVSLNARISSWYIKDAVNEANPTENYRYTNQFNNNRNNLVSLMVSIPIFNRNQTKIKKSEAATAILDSELRKENTENNLHTEIRELCSNTTNARNNFSSLTKSTDLYKEIQALRTTQYNLGATTFLDYITAKNNLEASEIELLKSKYNLYFYIQMINFYSGNNIYSNN